MNKEFQNYHNFHCYENKKGLVLVKDTHQYTTPKINKSSITLKCRSRKTTKCKGSVFISHMEIKATDNCHSLPVIKINTLIQALNLEYQN